MSTGLHAALTGVEIHTPYRQVFANAAARLADATVYTAADLYKTALQLDSAATYYLSSFAPTVWTSTSGGSGEVNTASNVGTGDGVFKTKVGTDLEFKSLLAGPNVLITPTADELIISASSGGEVNTASNVGAGSGWFRSKVLADLTFKSIIAGTNITLGVGADDITVNTTAEANTASNVGAGAGVFRSKTGVDLAFKSLIAGTGVTITPAADDITVAVVPPKTPITWGNSGVSSTTTTRYLTPWYEDVVAPTTVIQWRVPFAGAISLMRVRQTGAGNGNAIVYTLRVGGVASTLTVSLASTGADGSDLVHSVAVAAGDLVDIEVTKAASVGTSPSDITVSVQYAPT